MASQPQTFNIILERIGMKMNLIFSTIKGLCAYLWLSDIVIALISLFILSSIHQKLTNKGPMLWPVMGIVPTLAFNVNQLYEWATAALIKSGGTFHYRGVWMGGARGIVTSDPSKIEYMLKTNFDNFPKGKTYRERFHELLGDGIFNVDGELWKVQRRVANAEMHSSRHLECAMQSVRDLVHDKLLRVLEKGVKMGSQIDLQEILLRFTFDNVCSTAFGVDPGCLALDLPEIPFANAFEEATESTLVRFLVPPFFWKPMRFFGLGSEKRLKEGVKVVHEFVEKTVRERKSELSNTNNTNSDHADLLSRLITMDLTDEQGKKNGVFSDELLRDFCISFILAGRDTSSVGLAWFFWLVTKNPQVERKIIDEIKEIINNRKEESSKKRVGDDEIVFTVDELKKMVYLQAALSESLRLYPPVPVDWKEVQKDDVYPDGNPIKKGDRVVYSIYSMARLESVWGKDCSEFKPERWIGGDGECMSRNQFKYAVFNGGPRLCVGKKFAYLQMKMVAASVLLRYVVKVIDGHQVCPKITTTLYMKHGLLVTLEPRLNLC